ncbi:unnamed protein product [Didymodactylos carnosus]|uniref:Peptidoglycan recognition protein family domain-containing protein n=1 Tax=Didymodactylos carnosus TaxID=1234261 RepID=A0A814ZSB8_9BILA|nr:unnamed protein product [Didymodactylos carnosus]CAF1249312.1 unnamed protein product [Didymodactylos carnosus]CAF3708766.1 unnamed protein product [Didymodactylos carnosus]CAF4017653.1 unnamed protein product [Didymodactylos carnosus]
MATSTPEKDNDVDYQLSLGCPNILNRSSWNARPYTNRDNLTLPVTHIVVHQLEDLNSTMNPQDCIKKIKELQDEHVTLLGWSDIGYNFILCNDNDDQQQIYTSRGWKHIAAHCKGFNSNLLGIGVMGNYTDIKSLNAFKSLIQCGIIKNDIIENFTLVGHKHTTDIYEYYLKYFRNVTDLQYSNQASSTQTRRYLRLDIFLPFYCTSLYYCANNNNNQEEK